MQTYPAWFPRALAVSILADEMCLEIREAEWLIECKAQYPRLDLIPPAQLRYVEWLHAKSRAAAATRRKRIAGAPRI